MVEGLMGLLALIPVLGDIIEKVIPDPNKRIELNLELARIAVNKTEAGHSSIFVAGWRPAVGWSCVAGFLYTVLIAPAFSLGVADVAFLRDVLLGMLGINVLARSVEKIKGVAENTLAPQKAPVTPIALSVEPRPKKKGLDLWPF
jgi:hypothetical protein